MNVSRRQFFKICAGGMAGTAVAAIGLAPRSALAETREYKLIRSIETRNNCTFCSVGCGLLLYSRGDDSINSIQSVFHVEGDPDHPISRGSLCPKGAGVLDFINSQTRQKYPQYRAPGSNKWQRISWQEAIDRIARLLKADRDANFIRYNKAGTQVNRWTTTGWLISSAASNETGWLAVKVIRSLGLLPLETQARVCHGPSVAALSSSFGRGAMTNNWTDIKNSNLVIVMGANTAEAHPVGFKWAVAAKTENKAKIIVIDPRFTRSAAVADHYVPLRSGTDIAFLLGVIRYLISHDIVNYEYVIDNSNASFLVRDDYSFTAGLFSGFEPAEGQYNKSSWAYQVNEKGYAKRDPNLTHPRCVWNLLKVHVDRYTPQVVNNITGTSIADFLLVCKELANTVDNHRAATFLYALGWTQHSYGTQIIRTAAMIQLILGNIGVMGGGVNALRGHSNIQGLTDVGLLSTRLPAYLDLPSDEQSSLTVYLDQKTPKALGPKEINYWKNYPNFFISFMKSMYGDQATASNDWCFNWLPKWDKSYDVLRFSKMMHDGQENGFICQGFNPLASFPDNNMVREGLSKLKFLVVIDPLLTESAEFWQNHGEMNDVDPATIQTEVFNLPTTCFAEEFGTIVNSARWLQWHWAATPPPYEAKNDISILSLIYRRLRELYLQESGVFPDPIINLHWDYDQKDKPSAEELAKEYNGRALIDIKDDKGNLLLKEGEQLSSYHQLRNDGTTACGIWIFCGCWTPDGNQMAQRDPSDPSGRGIHPNWSWCWPMNRRILYNRASTNRAGQPLDPSKLLVRWTGKEWQGNDVPDFPKYLPPQQGTGAFIWNNDGCGSLFCLNRLVDGPFPEHYEPFESPIGTNILHPNQITNPAARVFKEDRVRLGTFEKFPYVATTYSITELFHFWSQHSLLNVIAQPQQFIEISEILAKQKNIRNGDMVRVFSNRGYIKAVAVVTKRIPTLTANGKIIQTVGITIPWGFTGLEKKSFLVNSLSLNIGDANSQTPEYKTFLVNIEKV